MFMDTTYTPPSKLLTRFMLFATAALSIAASMMVDMTLFDRTFLYEGPPDWQISGFIRTALSLIGGVAVALAIYPEAVPARGLRQITGTPKLAFGTLVVLTYGVHAWTVYALAYAPEALRDAAEELGSIALLQEGAIALAFVFLLLTAVTSNKLNGAKILGLPARLVAVGMAVAVLVLLLEETSYGQHYFGWATPSQFEGNLQQETNLHNFYTIRYEMVYYGVAFLAFIVLPLLLPSLPRQIGGQFERFVPPADFALLAMPLVAGMYASWNIMPQQVMFFAGVVVMALMLWRWNMIRSLGLFGLGVIVVAQAFYLLLGSKQIDAYEVAEIREASICLALLAYAVWFWHRNRRSN